MANAIFHAANDVERIAIGRLRTPEIYPGLPPLAFGGNAPIRIYRFEALGCYYAWLLVETESQFVVRRVIWDRPADFRPGVTDPTTLGSEGRLSTKAGAEIVTALSRISVQPFLPASAAGLDGVHYGVEQGGFLRTAALFWWEDLPPAWLELRSWLSKSVETLDAALPASTR